MVKNIDSSRILYLWSSLETIGQGGLFKRRLNIESVLKVYLTLSLPDRYYGIAFVLEDDLRINLKPYEKLDDLRVHLIRDGSTNYLLVQLLQVEYRDVFATLCCDLLNLLDCKNAAEKQIKVVLNQIARWIELLQQRHGDGLSSPEQQGLFGEILFLKKILLRKGVDKMKVLDSWVGVERALRDFQGASWAVEVKTSKGSNPQNVKISSERQLDESFYDNLYLYHCSLEVSKNNGCTLNELIDSIRFMLKDDETLLRIFIAKLIVAGYFEIHKALYDESHYYVRTETIYRVTDNFPRIKESDLRNGVGCIEYSISLSGCDKYEVTEDVVFESMGV